MNNSQIAVAEFTRRILQKITEHSTRSMQATSDFLNEDMELILEYADKKAKEKQAAAVEEENKAGQLRSKTRKKKEY